MKLILKPLLLLALLFSLIASITSVSAQPARFIEGTHYTELSDPVRTADPNKVEVTEIFWYGCPHCYAFEPLIESFEAGLASDVAFVRSPGIWNQMMEVHAQIYYVAEELGVFAQIHLTAFSEIHERGNYLQTAEQVKDMFIEAGVTSDDFDRVWGSFSMVSAVRKASSNMSAYGVRSVPNIIVNGKYRIESNEAVTSQAELLEVVSFLVEKERTGS